MPDNVNKVSRYRIQQLRENLGLRRTEFGAKLGYSYEQIQRMEDGLIAVTDDLCEKICEEYKVSMAWLQEKDVCEEPCKNEEQRRAQRFRQAYMESGITYRDLAKRSHTAVSMLSDVMSGRKSLTMKYAKKLEETLGVSADWLLYGDEESKEYPLTDAMMKYIKTHPEIRKEIKQRMDEENTETELEEKGCCS